MSSALPTPLAVQRLNIGRQVLHSAAASIKDLAQQLGDDFLKASNLLAVSRQVVVTGVGKSGLIGQKIAATLTATGICSCFMHAGEALHGDLGRINAGDTLLALSYSGTTTELKSLLPAAKHLGCRNILISASKTGPLAAAAEIVLAIGVIDEACPIALSPTTSTTMMLALGDALAMSLFAEQADPKAIYQRNHPAGALGRKVVGVTAVMRTGLALPLVRHTADLAAALTVMGCCRAGAAIVVDQHQKLQGIFTDGDLRRLLQQRRMNHQLPIADLMQQPKTVQQHWSIAQVEQLFQEHQIDQAPVVDDQQRVVGLVDIQDILTPIYRLNLLKGLDNGPMNR